MLHPFFLSRVISYLGNACCNSQPSGTSTQQQAQGYIGLMQLEIQKVYVPLPSFNDQLFHPSLSSFVNYLALLGKIRKAF